MWGEGMKKNTGERGQVLVLIILAIVGIFGFAALAVDVGRVYSERRRAQNAADAAAYAAAFAATQGDNYRTAGKTSVKLNGYDDTDMGPNLDIETDVQIYNPPISGKYAVATETINPSEYFQVFITANVDQVFSQFVYNGPMEFTVEAVARSTGSRSFAGGASIVATCEDCCDALRFRGDSEIYVTDGNIISNSDPVGCDSGSRVDATTCIKVDDGSINLAGSLSQHANSNCEDEAGNELPGIVGDINENSDDLWAGNDPGMPGCESIPGMVKIEDGKDGKYNNVGTVPGHPLVLSPGIYPKGIKISGVNSVVSLSPGMYCLDEDLVVNSGSLVGEDVMFVMRKSSSININTSQPVTLSAPGKAAGEAEDPNDCIEDSSISAAFCWSGFLVYMPYSNKGTITFSGGNTTTYTGTIYAAGPTLHENDTKCKIVGNGEELGLKASLICYTIDVGGTGTIKIDYYDEINAQSPAILELSK